MSPTNTVLLVSLLTACGDHAEVAPDAAPVPKMCAPTDDTENGGSLFSCVTPVGYEGVCTQDLHGFIQCFPTCTARLECDAGSSAYVLQLADNTRPCFCVPNQAAPP